MWSLLINLNLPLKLDCFARITTTRLPTNNVHVVQSRRDLLHAEVVINKESKLATEKNSCYAKSCKHICPYYLDSTFESQDKSLVRENSNESF